MISPVEVRTYTAKSQPEAAAMFGTDAGEAAGRGFYPSTQIWSGPQMWRVVVTPLILMLAGYLVVGTLGLVGGAVIAILYLVFFRPKGALTVTYLADRTA